LLGDAAPDAGTGLGIELAAHIVRDHGGKLEHRRALARGTELMLSLPRTRP
jgi:nitrogen-specific signal transduction histidine kinase